MVSDSNPRTPVSQRPVNTTPIHTGSRTLYRFDDIFPSSNDHYSALAEEMSPYFVGPMPVDAFLSEFFPTSKLLLPEVVPSFTPGMFASVVTQNEEVRMYDPFVCP
jgi:hypothetical protein